MVLCNIIAIAIGKSTMPNPGVGQTLPMPQMFGGMRLAYFISNN